MFDVAWSEILLVGAVAVVVIGPGEIPQVMRAAGRAVRRLQYVRFALSQQFEELMKEQDIDDLRRSVNFEAKDFDEKSADEEEEASNSNEEKRKSNIQ